LTLEAQPASPSNKPRMMIRRFMRGPWEKSGLERQE
jgi:hypothetical protein